VSDQDASKGDRPRRAGRHDRDDAAARGPRRDKDGPAQRGGRRSTERTGRSPGSDRPVRDGARRDQRPAAAGTDAGHRSGSARHVDEPALPDDIKASDLDKAARGELRTLTKENADAVARHLVAASRVIEDDPAEALRHALAAGRRAGRVAVVRESVAIAAYAAGDFALALRELRTFRRISGSDDQIALMVDSERGVGRPDRALEVGRSVDRATLPVEAQVGLAIAMSGARLDLEDPSAALDELERSPMDLQRIHEWSPSLFSAFATVNEELGNTEDAARWRTRAASADRVLSDVDAEQDSITIETELTQPDEPDELADPVEPEPDDASGRVPDGPDEATPSAASEIPEPGPDEPAPDEPARDEPAPDEPAAPSEA
jgi:23S rRNA pseudouridine2605 synthase